MAGANGNANGTANDRCQPTPLHDKESFIEYSSLNIDEMNVDSIENVDFRN